MFLIETHIKSSEIDGVGLFTTHAIKRGVVVARWDTRVDQTFTHEIFDELPVVIRSYIKKHGTRSATGEWKLGADGDQFINHSDDPNLIRNNKHDSLVASRDIHAGEELTCDYRPYRNDIL